MTAISDDCPRYRAAWVALGWVLVAGVVTGSLLPSDAVPRVAVWDKLQHLAAYAALAFVFAGALGRGRWKSVLAGLALLGAALEIAQGASGAGRQASGLDAVANLLGAGVGLAAAALVPGGWCRRFEGWLGARGERP